VGHNQSYVAFVVRDVVGNPAEFHGNLMVIPFVVLGPIRAAVDSLGVTVQPQLPYLILHAPPGDGSSSEFLDTKTTCREFTDTYAQDGSNSTNLAVKLGVKGSLGFINTIDYEFSVTLSGGVTAGDLSVKTSSNQTCVTVSEGFMTTELSGPDGGGDVFIGYGTDLVYGVYEYWKLNKNACNISLDTGLIYAPVGQPRPFASTKTSILSNIALLQERVNNTALRVKTRNDAQNQIDVWRQVLSLNDANVNKPNNVLLESPSFSSGVSRVVENSITVSETNSIQVEHYIEGNAKVDVVVNIGGSGVAGGYEYKSSKRFGKTQSQTAESAKVLRYTLADSNPGDEFNLDVYRDPMYGTPIFKTKAGTKSSCPYQGGYQRDQPKLKHTGRTSDRITILKAPLALDSSAIFQVDVCNESNEPRTYLLRVNDDLNPGGARIFASGFELNVPRPYSLKAFECQTKTIEVKRLSTNSTLSYPDLQLLFYPQCEEDIQSSVSASVYFGNATGTKELLGDAALLSVFPNPTSGLLQVDLAGDYKIESYQLSDITGKMVRTVQMDHQIQKTELDLSALPKGVFVLQVRSGKRVFARKVMVQ